MVELWHPLAQDYNSVLYTDLRLMGDNRDNSEFNLGIGRRYLTNEGEAALGLHAWIDRRMTKLGSTFYQLAGGYEYMTPEGEIRLNAYLPINQKEVYLLPNVGSTTPYLSGTGIYYDGAGSIIERPMHGADIEAGRRFTLPIAPQTNFRAAAGAFIFSGEGLETVKGGRFRLSADITSDFEVGTRFETDNVRGAQGFLEATLRFPFGSKAANETLTMRNRLDESPERDIDIVSGSQVDTGMRKPVINAETGQAQRIFYVDNTAAAGGNGSIEHPFNAISSANAAATMAGDTVYVYNGDGTSTNYDTGIALHYQGQALVGEGSAFVFDGTRFRAGSNTASFDGYTLIAAGATPTLSSDGSTDAAVEVYADDVTLSGFNVENSLGNGIQIVNANNPIIENVTTNNNAVYGLYYYADDGQSHTFSLSNYTSNNNYHGIEIDALGANTTLEDMSFDNINVEGNQRGLLFYSDTDSIIRNITISNSSALNQSAEGFVFTGSGKVSNVTFDNIYAENVYNGILIQSGGGYISGVTINDFVGTLNTAGGIRLRTTAGSALIEDIAINNAQSNNNDATSSGIQIISGPSTTTMRNITIDGGTFNGNGQGGISVSSTGTLQNLTIQNVTTNNNTNSGIAFSFNTGSAASNITVDGVTSNSNTGSGISVSTLNSGAANGMTFSNIAANGNAIGFNVATSQTSNLTGLSISDSSFTGSTGVGMYLRSTNTSALNASVEHVTSTANATNGVYFDDDTTGSYSVDFGGGGVSAGNNRIFGNTGRDLRVDLDGVQLKAENNWWGSALGLQAGQQTLEVGSTVDAAPFLAADPGP